MSDCMSEDKLIDIDEAITEYTKEHGHTPDFDWLSNECGITSKEAYNLLCMYQHG